MKRRDFLKSAVVGAGLLGSGVLPGKGGAASSNASGNTFGNKRKGVDFYRIDSYCHLTPRDSTGKSFFDILESHGGGKNPNRAIFDNVPAMYDIADRLQMMDDCGIDLSILIPSPGIETSSVVFGNPDWTLQAAQWCNNALANIVYGNPNKFKWVALLPTNNLTNMLYEFERAVTNNDPLHPVASKAVGGVFYVGPTMKPPDHPDYLQLYALAEQLNAPIWIHPGRPQIFPDYLFDPALPLNIPNVPVNVPAIASKYYLFLLLDWLLDSSVAMARIVFANVFGLYPDVKIIIHHKGALVPLFRNRLTYDLYEWINQRVPGAINTGIPPSITGSYVDHFKNFYVDTVFSGDASFETEIVQIVYDFFGPDHVLFGTDAPVNGVDDGRAGSLAARYSVEALQVPNKDVQNIFSNNILNIIPD